MSQTSAREINLAAATKLHPLYVQEMRWWLLTTFLCSLLVLQAGSAGGKDTKKKKSILDYNEADVERIFREWEVH